MVSLGVGVVGSLSQLVVEFEGSMVVVATWVVIGIGMGFGDLSGIKTLSQRPGHVRFKFRGILTVSGIQQIKQSISTTYPALRQYHRYGRLNNLPSMFRQEATKWTIPALVRPLLRSFASSQNTSHAIHRMQSIAVNTNSCYDLNLYNGLLRLPDNSTIYKRTLFLFFPGWTAFSTLGLALILSGICAFIFYHWPQQRMQQYKNT
ncbi:hypothetical protein HYPSUDRAFT_62110 [Hypholoma sublateritium FD-334 SS-4]|uniref:Uncharacterized protein n=1 Tax=Hypholoma sublateritium (strain FD-334 SS-4) TaxID=945553 RepID=A0A0D2PJ42_HYPSF|nr:hypothetical protein HYPSUDRAFT_62110 [Hypholoma sublateritium FD-334 SS-4]